MPIVSSQIVTNKPNGIGRISITEKHTDHLGIEHFLKYRASEGFDTASALSKRAVDLEKSLEENEISGVLGGVRKRLDPLVESNKLKYAARNDFVKRLVLEMMSSSDVDFIVKAKTLIVDFLSNQTDLEIQTLLVIDQTQVDQLRARADSVYRDKNSQKTFETIYLEIKASLIEVDI